MTLDAICGGDCYLVSYHVSGKARSAAARECQIVFGRRRMARGRARQDPGFIHRQAVVWIGQSVLVMPFPDANELAERLRRLGVQVAMAPMAILWRVWLDRRNQHGGGYRTWNLTPGDQRPLRSPFRLGFSEDVGRISIYMDRL